MMKARLNARDLAPRACAALRGVEAYLRNCGLEHSLLQLVKLRASQINRCAHCLEMSSCGPAGAARRSGGFIC
jgi:alkylhydroperoxidase family enzyme